MSADAAAVADALVLDAIVARHSGAARALATALAADPGGRGATWRLLVAAGLEPFAGCLLQQHGQIDALPPPQASFLRRAFEHNAIRQALLLREAADVASCLAGAGIPALWMKGAWISAFVLERPGMRRMEDVDLLVPPDRVERAAQVLAGVGYRGRPGPGPADGMPVRAVCREVEALQPPGTVEIEIHGGIVASSAGRTWDTGPLWHSAHSRHWRGTPVLVPAPAAGLVLVALHAFKHAYDVRHAWSAVLDAAGIVSAAGDTLDLDLLRASMRDPLVAAACYLLFGRLARSPAATPATSALHAAARDRVDALGVRHDADRLHRLSGRLRPMADGDFSLMLVGEQRGPFRLLAHLLTGIGRWRRRVDGAPATTSPRPARLLRALRLATRANWRYAHVTFQAGRLARRLGPAPPDATAPDASGPGSPPRVTARRC